MGLQPEEALPLRRPRLRLPLPLDCSYLFRFNARETRSLTCQRRAQAYTCWGARARGVRTVFEVVSRLAEEDGGKFDPTAEIECEVQGGGVGLLDHLL